VKIGDAVISAKIKETVLITMVGIKIKFLTQQAVTAIIIFECRSIAIESRQTVLGTDPQESM
jgi:hypothetical protein